MAREQHQRTRPEAVRMHAVQHLEERLLRHAVLVRGQRLQTAQLLRSLLSDLAVCGHKAKRGGWDEQSVSKFHTGREAKQTIPITCTNGTPGGQRLAYASTDTRKRLHETQKQGTYSISVTTSVQALSSCGSRTRRR